MTAFVLVHGGWHGGWCWHRVAPILRAAGHDVFTPTMTGLGERSHLVHRDITPSDHVQDVRNVLRFEDLADVVLVGHSYGGFIVSGVAAEDAARLKALIYVDAFVPEASGEAAQDTAPPGRVAVTEEHTKDGLVAPYGFDRWAGLAEDQDWLRRFATPHPARCFSEGVTLTGREQEVPRKLYILCTRHKPSPFWAAHARVKALPDWEVAEMDCLHDAMVEAPEELAAHLLRYA
ncbi:MAG: alpha/beta hydrolase [Pseudomonadota bacterium]